VLEYAKLLPGGDRSGGCSTAREKCRLSSASSARMRIDPLRSANPRASVRTFPSSRTTTSTPGAPAATTSSRSLPSYASSLLGDTVQPTRTSDGTTGIRAGASTPRLSAPTVFGKREGRACSSEDHRAPSSSRSVIFRSRPPAYPVRSPLEPTTRWHGRTIGMRFRFITVPTARAARGRPTRCARAP
jgi:hypothetical protein